MSLKPYPACRITHVYLDALFEIINDDGVQPRDITSVKAHVGQPAVILCQPEEARRHPETVMDAKVSVPFVLSLAMARRGLAVDDFTADVLRDPAVFAEMDKFSYVYDPSLDVEWPAIVSPGVLEVTTSSGATITKRVQFPSGSPHKPMSTEAQHAKFFDCAAHAAVPIPEPVVGRAIELLDTIETSADVAAIPRLLGGEPANGAAPRA
jgi:2-methylcitrate dehydratase PrpD